MSAPVAKNEQTLKWIIRIISLTILIFQIYAMSMAKVPVMVHRLCFLALVMLLIFVKPARSKWERITQLVFIPILVLHVIYYVLNTERIVLRIPYVDNVTSLDIFFGVALVIILLEATRRCAGWGLTSICGIAIAYAFLGSYLPGALAHRGASLVTFTELQVLSPGGIFGQPIGAIIAFVFYFIVFTSFLEASGAGQLFIDGALSVAGRTRGGPAKASVIASGAMGSISGSAVANVAATGAFTIPLMKRTGFQPHVAGAIEAAASTGGQLMPPIMGAAAFVMAEITGIPYAKIALSALVPALLFYSSVFFQVDLYAKKTGLVGLKKEQLPSLKESTKRFGHLMIPLILLIYYIFSGASLMTAGLKSTIWLIALSFLRKETRMWPMRCLDALTNGFKSLPGMTIPCAAAGIIVGIVIDSNLGIKFSELFLILAGGNKLLTLIAIMFVCIILGMGMPTISAYIIVVLLMVPNVIQLGVPILAAHLFVFYFALMSFVTPPVALAAYTAAGIAESDASKTGWRAFGFVLAGFLIPFILVYNQALILEGPVTDIIAVIFTSLVGIYVLAGAVAGIYLVEASIWERGVGAIAAMLLVVPELVTDLLGLAVVAGLFAVQFFKLRRQRLSLQNSAGGGS